MDRASDSGSEGWGFESLPAYQKRGCKKSPIKKQAVPGGTACKIFYREMAGSVEDPAVL